MKTLEETIAQAMDCQDKSILPFLPYILQDFWEIGSSANSILKIVKTHTNNYSELNVLDLGCGKGAISIKLSIELDCYCFGIDAIPEFIEIANKKAREEAITSRCKFISGDAREIIKTLNQFNLIILGSIGPVFGNYFDTMTILKKNLTKDGLIILDDGYFEDDQPYKHEFIIKKSMLFKQIDKAGMKLLKEYTETEINQNDEYEMQFDYIKQRCEELAIKYSDKKYLFDNYIEKQRYEYNNLENIITCATMVIQNK